MVSWTVFGGAALHFRNSRAIKRGRFQLEIAMCRREQQVDEYKRYFLICGKGIAGVGDRSFHAFESIHSHGLTLRLFLKQGVEHESANSEGP